MADRAREQRLVFGEIAEDYDRHRPHYPTELFDLLLARAAPDAVLDVGTGTGRAAQALATRGLPGHAVEPSAEMAGVARRHLPDEWTIEIADFERCRAADRTDWRLITCAQAWHWIDHDRGLARAHELLDDGGVLATFWNRPEFHQDALRHDLDEIYDRLAPDMPSSLRGRGTEPKGAISDVVDGPPPPGFDPVELVELRWEREYTTRQWIDLLGTHSDHRLLEPDHRRRLHDEVAAAIDRHGGVFTLPYRVELLVFTKR